jgi:DNA-binding LacI/PurR family transcriptional regulator
MILTLKYWQSSAHPENRPLNFRSEMDYIYRILEGTRISGKGRLRSDDLGACDVQSSGRVRHSEDSHDASPRVKRSSTIGVIAPEVADAYGSLIISGIERYLRANGFFYLTVAHHHDNTLLESYWRLLLERGVEGFVTVNTSIVREPPLPTIAIAGHRAFAGVTNIVLDHKTAAFSALRHLLENGHREFAFMKGPVISSDTEDRWGSIVEASRELGIRIHPDLVVELNDPRGCAARAPEYAYPFAKELLSRNRAFTALFAFNDNSAIAAMSAIQETGLRVPEDVSIIGFDDIQLASYSSPTLTTVRQPLEKMGEIAARTLLDRIANRSYVAEIAVEPELIVRQSTGPARDAKYQLQDRC